MPQNIANSTPKGKPDNSKPLKNKVAVVTGAGSGIGAACAELLVQQGAKVMLVGRTKEKLLDTADSIAKRYPDAVLLVYPKDISIEADVKAIFTFLKEKWGYVSILVNNAGIIEMQPFTDMPISTWDAIYNTNVRGIVLCCQQAFQQMIASKKGGSIVNVSSLGGIPHIEKFPGMAAYVTSKFAVSGLTEALALEGKPHHIRVNAVAPGATDTPMLHKAAPQLKTSTKPMDIAHAILYFCNDAASGKVSGSTLPIYSNE